MLIGHTSSFLACPVATSPSLVLFAGLFDYVLSGPRLLSLMDLCVILRIRSLCPETLWVLPGATPGISLVHLHHGIVLSVSVVFAVALVLPVPVSASGCASMPGPARVMSAMVLGQKLSWDLFKVSGTASFPHAPFSKTSSINASWKSLA